LEVSESKLRIELLLTGADYLQFSGWKDIEIVDLCARDAEGNRVTDDNGTAISGEKLEGSATHLDPLWIVRGVKG
jgi:hypothetical protein